MNQSSENCKKPYFLDPKPHFWAKITPFWPKTGKKIFSKNPAPSLFDDYSFASSCKKLENFNEPISRKTHNRQTDGRTNG